MDWSLFLQIAGAAGSIASLLVVMTWWLSRQFSSQTERFFNKMDTLFEKISVKLDYHERHDDKRFSEIREDLSELRIRNAYIDAKLGKVFDQKEEATIRSHRRNQDRETGEMQVS